MAGLGNALNLHWAFGFTKDQIGGVQSLCTHERNALFFLSSHSGIIYDFENRTQTILQGHCNIITCCAIDSKKRWIVTADAGFDPIIVVWDAVSCVPVKTFASPHENGISAIDISNDALYIATLSAKNSSGVTHLNQELAIWAWTREESSPIVKQTIAASEYHHSIKFDPKLSSQIVSTGDKTVCFWSWNELSLDSYYGRASKSDLGKYSGKFVSTVFLPATDNAITATSSGYVIVWETQNSSRKGSVADKMVRSATKAVRLVECAINVMTTTTNDYLVLACSDGAVRFYDYFLRLEAWFEDLDAGPVTSVSFSMQTCPYPSGEAGSPGLKFWAPDFLVGTTDAFVVGVESELFDEVRKENRRGTLLMQGVSDEVTAIATHPFQHLVAITTRNGVLQVWNYEMKLLMMLREFNGLKAANIALEERSSKIAALFSNCVAFDNTGNILAIGFSSGIIRLLNADTLEDIASYAPSSESIERVAFSPSGKFIAASCSASHHVMLFVREENADDLFGGPVDKKRLHTYSYVGRTRSHTAQITGLQFGIKDGVETLVSISEDRYCIEYDLQSSNAQRGVQCVAASSANNAGSGGKKLQQIVRHCVELVAKPTAMMWHPRLADDVEDRFVFANDEFKFKELNADSKQCRKTTLAPRFGAPATTLLHIPKQRPSTNLLLTTLEAQPPQFYAFAAASRVVGVGMFPLTGNPEEVMGIVAHPSPITALGVSFDGKFLFSAGGSDLAVNMWELALPNSNDICKSAADSSEKTSRDSLKPFLSLLEGGEDGELHRDIIDYFYYCQLRSCSEDSMDPRNLPGTIPLEELPSLFRSVGYYPSEVEVNNVINEIRYKKFMITGETQESVGLSELISLYANHRPVLPLEHEFISSAFSKISMSLNSLQLTWGTVSKCLMNQGEKISADDLNAYLIALVGDNTKSISDDSIYGPKAFAESLLGFEEFSG